MIESNLVEPPPSPAGLVQRTCWPAFGVRAKIAFAGGVALKLEKATTQPVWLLRLQAGTFWNDPPRSLPVLTVMLPPSRIAETSRLRTAGFLSICFWISVVSRNEPCE